MVVVVAAALLVVVLAAWSSSIGPDGVLRGEGMGPLAGPSDSVAESDAPAETATDDGDTSDVQVHAWVKVVWWVLNVALAVLVAVLLARYVLAPLVRRTRARRSRRLSGEGAEPRFEALDAPRQVARALLDDAADQRRHLVDDASARNAVVECWSRFEIAAARTGLARRPWETSSEFTMRLLDLVDAHEPAVARLADLYREARFSEHELTEDDRAAALEALDTIHHTIGVPT